MKNTVLICFMNLLFISSSSAQCFTDNYDANTGWTQVGSDATVDGGNSNQAKIASTSAASGDRVHKSLGLTLSDTGWNLDIDHFQTSISCNPCHGSYTLAALTAGTTHAETSNQDMIGIKGEIASVDLSHLRLIRIYYKDDAGLLTESTGMIATPNLGTTYYMRLVRESATSVRAEVYSDPARTIPMPGSPISMTIPSTVQGLTHVQHGARGSGCCGVTYDVTSDNLSITCAPLPIELISFTANWQDGSNNAVVLDWITATEINNEYFEIERSTDGVNFTTILRVDGAGNSSQTINYQELDLNPYKEGPSYYRLKQVDFDGTYEYSQIEVLNIKEGIEIIGLYPNPIDDILNFSVISSINAEVKMNIFNAVGQVVYSRTYSISKGVNPFNITPPNLNDGNYYLEIALSDGKYKSQAKFIVNKKH